MLPAGRIAAFMRAIFLLRMKTPNPCLHPVMQMQIKHALKSRDGAELRSEVINTIHPLGD